MRFREARFGGKYLTKAVAGRLPRLSIAICGALIAAAGSTSQTSVPWSIMPARCRIQPSTNLNRTAPPPVC